MNEEFIPLASCGKLFSNLVLSEDEKTKFVEMKRQRDEESEEEEPERPVWSKLIKFTDNFPDRVVQYFGERRDGDGDNFDFSDRQMMNENMFRTLTPGTRLYSTGEWEDKSLYKGTRTLYFALDPLYFFVTMGHKRRENVFHSYKKLKKIGLSDETEYYLPVWFVYYTMEEIRLAAKTYTSMNHPVHMKEGLERLIREVEEESTVTMEYENDVLKRKLHAYYHKTDVLFENETMYVASGTVPYDRPLLVFNRFGHEAFRSSYNQEYDEAEMDDEFNRNLKGLDGVVGYDRVQNHSAVERKEILLYATRDKLKSSPKYKKQYDKFLIDHYSMVSHVNLDVFEVRLKNPGMLLDDYKVTAYSGASYVDKLIEGTTKQWREDVLDMAAMPLLDRFKIQDQ